MISSIESAKNLGLNSVRITGGEPFLRDEVVGELLRCLDRMDIDTLVETNGTLFSAHTKKIMTEVQPKVMISMDGASSRGFASLRGNPHLFDSVVENIEFLRDSGLSVVCSMTIHRGNMNELDDFVNLTQNLGTARLLLYIEVGRARNMDSKLTTQEMVQLIKKMNALMEENPKISSNLPFALLDPDVSYYACKAGRESLALLPDGSVSFCAYSAFEKDMVAGNIKETSLEEILENGEIFQQFHKIESSLQGVCKLCIFKKYCQGSCRAWAYDAYGSLFAPYPLCQRLYEEGFFPKEYLWEEKV
jgi:cyclic pyranopterin phosphate synthase